MPRIYWLTEPIVISHRLSAEEQNAYLEQGYLIRPSVFNPDELTELRHAAEEACSIARKKAEKGRTYFLDDKRFVDINYLTVQFEHVPGTDLVRVIEPVHELHNVFERLVDDPRLVAPMKDVLDRDQLSLWTAKLNLKPAQSGSGFGWHQDSPYWIHDSEHVDLLPNVMVTFDDATIENGCLQVIRGSHKQGCLPGTDDGTQLGGFFTDPNAFNLEDAEPMAVPAGSAIFFSPHAVHGSGPNTSNQPRRAIILTYQPAGFPALKSGLERAIANE
jgi:phytanoyl-CoA hydroxylase